MKNRERNLDQLRLAAIELTPLLDRMVFLGGCTTGLFISDPAAADIRPTMDVDVIVELAGRAEYHALEAQLRELGFAQPMEEDDPICRWRKGFVVVDIMPTDPTILGFGNQWYPEAIASAETLDLGNGLVIRVVTPPMFVATKIEAFEGRGKGDFYGSQDIEDLIAVIDGRKELVAELRQSASHIREYVSEHFARYKNTSDFRNALPGFISGFADSPSREGVIVERITQLCELMART